MRYTCSLGGKKVQHLHVHTHVSAILINKEPHCTIEVFDSEYLSLGYADYKSHNYM